MLKLYIFFLLININFICNANKNSATQLTDYPKFAYNVAHDDILFSDFRRQLSCRQVVETVDYELGLKFEKEIKDNYPDIIPFLKNISLQDVIGNPYKFNFSIGFFAPTTLRYIKIACDLQKHFGDLNRMSIAEIGGGYGGQCKILHNLFGFSKYTIIDLPECLYLINRFLSNYSIENIKISSNLNINIKNKYDLFISNYAIAEISSNEQLIYIEKIINSADNGYIIYNYNDSQIKPFTLEEFVKKISITGRKIIVEPEYPVTGPNNFVIIWKN